ncbi:MAG: ATP-binding protein [Gemmataceae bacterium]
MIRLHVIAGPDRGQQFTLNAASLTLGRHSTSDIVIHDDEISRRHLEFTQQGSGYQLRDLGSNNGTFVNRLRLTDQPLPLQAGDEIQLGQTILRYTLEGTVAGRVRMTTTSPLTLPGQIRQTIPEDAGSVLFTHASSSETHWLSSRPTHLTVLYEAANVVSEVLDIDELLARILTLIVPAVEADDGAFLVHDPETMALMPRAVRARTPDAVLSVSRTVIDHVLAARQGVLVTDAAHDDRFAGGESIARHKLHEVICVPMRGRHETVGVLFLSTTSPTPRFQSEQLQLAVAVAHQAALAVEETRYYQALIHAGRLAAVGQTIAAMSHHIKNIMQGVRFGGDMVRKALADDDRELLRHGWRLVEKNQAKIDELILDMLNYSKEREPSLEETDLGLLVAEVLEVVRGRAGETGVELVMTPPPETVRSRVDPDGLQRALLNVVSNAVDAVMAEPTGGRVVVAWVADATRVVLTVSDNGPGVTPEKAEDIFRPFVSTKGSRGTGLGLPVSRKILREHGGDLTVESGPVSGALFRLVWPR